MGEGTNGALRFAGHVYSLALWGVGAAVSRYRVPPHTTQVTAAIKRNAPVKGVSAQNTLMGGSAGPR